ncbi:MAG: SDR family NAD(P)-dependent oxidoreductase [Acidimicrobiia bacterium]
MIDFQDRVAIVTGAGRGLGRSHALLLASRGAAVVVNDPGVDTDGTGATQSAADQVTKEITGAGGAAVAEYSSVSEPGGGEAVVQKAVDEFGRVDIVVNNAGILRDKAFHNLEWPDLDAVIDVHLKGAFFVTKPAFVHMREQGYGRIVVTSSNAGILGNFGQTNYGSAKMGLVGFMNVLKLEGAKYDIKANTVAPIARTRMTEELLGPVADKLDPDLVSPVVAYFCSEACQFSGEIWSAGGGAVSRFFVGRTAGYFKHPDQEGPLTIEDVEQHLEEIRSEDGYSVLQASGEEIQQHLIPRLFE